MITTKGDNVAIADPQVALRDIIGTYKAHLPLLGYVRDGLTHPLGLALVVYLPALGIVMAEIKSLTRYYAVYSPRRYSLYRSHSSHSLYR